MYSLIMLFIIVAVGAVVFLNYWIASQFYEAACIKGYSSKKYLWIAFFFNIVGYLLVIALPNKNAILSNNEKTNELPKL